MKRLTKKEQEKLELEELAKECQLIRFDMGIPYMEEWAEYIHWLKYHSHDIKKKKFV